MRLLIVDDHQDLRDAIARRLVALGHAIDTAVDCGDAESFVRSYTYDVVVLDRMLPDGDAIDLLQRWRRQGLQMPVLFLTACDAVQDRVAGFASGGDDYLVKPFSMDELAARVTALGRRGASLRPSLIRITDLEVDLGRREVRRAGVLLPLRPKEFTLLQLLAERAGHVVTRGEIIAGCWGEGQEPDSNAEEVLVAALRRKLGAPALIRTVRGSGYRLDAPEPSPENMPDAPGTP